MYRLLHLIHVFHLIHLIHAFHLTHLINLFNLSHLIHLLQEAKRRCGWFTQGDSDMNLTKLDQLENQWCYAYIYQSCEKVIRNMIQLRGKSIQA